MVGHSEVQLGCEALWLLPILDILGLLGQMHMRFEVASLFQTAHQVLRQLPMAQFVRAAAVGGGLPVRLRGLHVGSQQVVRLYLLEGLFLHLNRSSCRVSI